RLVLSHDIHLDDCGGAEWMSRIDGDHWLERAEKGVVVHPTEEFTQRLTYARIGWVLGEELCGNGLSAAWLVDDERIGEVSGGGANGQIAIGWRPGDREAIRRERESLGNDAAGDGIEAAIATNIGVGKVRASGIGADEGACLCSCGRCRGEG